jgi:hypothetical protein
MHKKIYLSGAISKLTYEDALALFEAAEKEALKIADEVVNPMKLAFELFKPSDPNDITWGEYMVNDLHAIMNLGVDSIYMLENWEDSDGANIELFVAQTKNLAIHFQSQVTEGSFVFVKSDEIVI